MDIEKIYKSIESCTDINQQRQIIVAYLRECLPRLLDTSSRQQAAYDITGLSSTSYAHSLKREDDIEAIFTLAGELEVEGGGTSEDWHSLIEYIRQLSN